MGSSPCCLTVPLAVLLIIILSSLRVKALIGCDLYQGHWVYNASYSPYYTTSQCPFIESQFNCLFHRRPDSYYLHYQWRPDNCPLPRFNAREFLWKLRGKTIMFIGDSLGLNQWQSLNCMIHAGAPEVKYVATTVNGVSTFTYHGYIVRVMFSRNAFLVGSVRDGNATVLTLNSITGGDLWKQADVMVFNSWHWWLHTGRKQPWNAVWDGNATYADMDRLVMYEKALRTWARWVDSNVNPTTTRVFFQGVSPDHANASFWGGRGASSCVGEVRPVAGSVYPSGPHPAERVLERVLGTMRTPVNLLRITGLSQMRKDGHPSVYGLGGHYAMDCSHWCLAGVPDTWNELFSASLF